jgi:hypothetical protein
MRSETPIIKCLCGNIIKTYNRQTSCTCGRQYKYESDPGGRCVTLISETEQYSRYYETWSLGS